MAINTRNRRASVIGVGLPAPRVLPAPDGAIIDVDRRMLRYMYASLLDAFIIFVIADAAFRQTATADVELL